MKNVDAVRRLHVGVQFERLPFPQEGHPALDYLGPRRVRSFPLDRLVLCRRQLLGHLRHRPIGVAGEGRQRVHERICGGGTARAKARARAVNSERGGGEHGHGGRWKIDRRQRYIEARCDGGARLVFC